MTLRCSTCGEPALQLLSEDTRGTTITRRRRCPNEHVTKSIETYSAISEITRHLAEYDALIERRAAMWKRDQRIVRAVRAGACKAAVAAEHGLAANSVSAVLRKHAPDLVRRMRPKGARAADAHSTSAGSEDVGSDDDGR